MIGDRPGLGLPPREVFDRSRARSTNGLEAVDFILGLSFEPARLAQYGPRIGCFAAGLRFGLGSAPLGSAAEGVPDAGGRASE